MTSLGRPITGRGLFITFEGTEGCGKTTQQRVLVSRLRDCGYHVTENQEPGTTRIGTQIRRILLDPAHDEMSRMTELLLMFASRTQAAAEIIIPALERGHIVVSDRFTDSALAYQGGGRGLGFELVRKLHQLALGDLQPDITLCIEIDIETGLTRARRRNQTSTKHESEARLDQQSFEFHKRVAEAYKKISAMDPQRFHLIDGGGDMQIVAARVWSEVSPLLTAMRKQTVNV
jgi:dTMP kinase